MRQPSSHSLISLALAGVVTASGLAGCSQHYNGAWGLGSRDRQQAVAYRQFKEKQAQQLKQAYKQALQTNPEQLRSNPSNNPTRPMVQVVNRQSPAHPARPVHRPQTVQFDGGSTGSAPSQAIGMVSLYGQLPGQRSGPGSPLDGGANTRQVSFTSEGDDFDVAADPTGSKLVFASTRHRNTSDLYLQTVGGSAVTQLTTSPANDVMPAISPDGNRLAFASDRSGNWDLYLMDLSGGGQPIHAPIGQLEVLLIHRPGKVHGQHQIAAGHGHVQFVADALRPRRGRDEQDPRDGRQPDPPVDQVLGRASPCKDPKAREARHPQPGFLHRGRFRQQPPREQGQWQQQEYPGPGEADHDPAFASGNGVASRRRTARSSASTSAP